MSQYDPRNPTPSGRQTDAWQQAAQQMSAWQNAQSAAGSGADNPFEAMVRQNVEYRRSAAYENIWRVYFGAIFVFAAIMVGLGVYGAIAGMWYLIMCVPMGIGVVLMAVFLRKRQKVMLTQANNVTEWMLDQQKAMRQGGQWGNGTGQPPTGGS